MSINTLGWPFFFILNKVNLTRMNSWRQILLFVNVTIFAILQAVKGLQGKTLKTLNFEIDKRNRPTLSFQRNKWIHIGRATRYKLIMDWKQVGSTFSSFM